MKGNSAPLQGAGAEHFVLAEGFKGGGRDAGNGNRVAQRIEDFNGGPLRVIWNGGRRMVFDELTAASSPAEGQWVIPEWH